VNKGKGEKRPRDEEDEAAADSADAAAAFAGLEEIAPQAAATYTPQSDDDEDSSEEDLGLESGEDDARQKRNRLPNKSAEAGIIEKLVATNFMCHSNFEVTFGPNLNFITGLNGSKQSFLVWSSIYFQSEVRMY
jgi:hypothetical protein